MKIRPAAFHPLRRRVNSESRAVVSVLQYWNGKYWKSLGDGRVARRECAAWFRGGSRGHRNIFDSAVELGCHPELSQSPANAGRQPFVIFRREKIAGLIRRLFRALKHPQPVLGGDDVARLQGWIGMNVNRDGPSDLLAGARAIGNHPLAMYECVSQFGIAGAVRRTRLIDLAARVDFGRTGRA